MQIDIHQHNEGGSDNEDQDERQGRPDRDLGLIQTIRISQLRRSTNPNAETIPMKIKTKIKAGPSEIA